MTTLEKKVRKNLSEPADWFAQAIDFKALHKAMKNPKSRKELEEIFAKVK